jgi:hypothetical protein
MRTRQRGAAAAAPSTYSAFVVNTTEAAVDLD